MGRRPKRVPITKDRMKSDIQYLTSEIERWAEKAWLFPAIRSHLQTRAMGEYTLTEAATAVALGVKNKW